MPTPVRLPNSPSRAEMTIEVILHKSLTAAGIGDDFISDYTAKLIKNGIDEESTLAGLSEEQLLGFGLMRAHCMKIVQYYKTQMQAKTHRYDSPASSTAGTPFTYGPGLFPTLDEAAGGSHHHHPALRVSDFTCHICMDLVLSPRTISCGHTFCLRCLEHWAEEHAKPTCPLCRAPMNGHHGEPFVMPPINVMIHNATMKLFPQQCAKVQQLAEEQANRAELLRQEYMFTRHPPNATLVRILKGSAASGSVSEKLEMIMLRMPRAEFVSIRKRWTTSCDTSPIRLEGLLFNVSAPNIHAVSLHHLGIQPGDSVLDVGCGSCIVTCWAALQAGPNGSVHGIDLRSEILNFGLRNIQKQRTFAQDALCPLDMAMDPAWLAQLDEKDKDAVKLCRPGRNLSGIIHTVYIFGVAKAEQSVPISIRFNRWLEDGSMDVLLVTGRTAEGLFTRTTRGVAKWVDPEATNEHDGDGTKRERYLMVEEVQFLTSEDDSKLYYFGDRANAANLLAGAKPHGYCELLIYELIPTRQQAAVPHSHSSRDLSRLSCEDLSSPAVLMAGGGVVQQSEPALVFSVVVRTRRKDSVLLAKGQMRDNSLKQMEANSDLSNVCDPAYTLASLKNIRLFQGNALDPRTSAVNAVRTATDGYKRIYVGALIQNREQFEYMTSLIAVDGSLVAPYDGHLVVARRRSAAVVDVERICAVNFSQLENPPSDAPKERPNIEITRSDLQDFLDSIDLVKTYESSQRVEVRTEAGGASVKDIYAVTKEASVSLGRAIRALKKSGGNVTQAVADCNQPPSNAAFHTQCCQLPIYANLVPDVNAILGDAFEIFDSRVAVLDRPIVAKGTESATLFTPTASPAANEFTEPDPTQPGGATASGGAPQSQQSASYSKRQGFHYLEDDEFQFYSVFGSRMKVVLCACGRPVAMEFLEDPFEVGPVPAQPICKGMTVFGLTYAELGTPGPLNPETVPQSERIECRGCKGYLGCTSSVLNRERRFSERSRTRQDRLEQGCEVNFLRADSIDEPEPPRDEPHVDNRPSHRYVVRDVYCRNRSCNARLGFRYIRPVYNSGGLASVFRNQRFGLRIASINGVSFSGRDRETTMQVLFQGPAGGVPFANLIQAFAGAFEQGGGNLTLPLNLFRSPSSESAGNRSRGASGRNESSSADDDEDDEDPPEPSVSA